MKKKDLELVKEKQEKVRALQAEGYFRSFPHYLIKALPLCFIEELEILCEMVTEYSSEMNTLKDLQGEFTAFENKRVLYIWRFSDEPHLIKIGITSPHLKDKRIQQVARKHKTVPEVLRYRELVNAVNLERFLHKKLEKYRASNIAKVDGYTEIFELNQAQLNYVLAFVDSQ